MHTANHLQDTRGVENARRVLVIGTGKLGQTVAREMQSNPKLRLMPIGFLNDNSHDNGLHLAGLPVLGNLQNLAEVIQSAKIEQIIIAASKVEGGKIRRIVRICRDANLRVRIVPGRYHSLDDQNNIRRLRDVQVEDLLRNEPAQSDGSDLREVMAGKRVLVTGAGGSIGSELCRQIAQYKPAELMLLGHGEHSIFMLASEFTHLRPELPIFRVIADVRDADRIQKTLSDFRPHIVFHAAAHKHVPLMEENIEDAVSNNVLGTNNLVQAALSVGVEKFILISTDKAVSPTSVMGATKRIAELIVCKAAQQSGGCYESVRFGNVLGSRGSVLSIFREQITHGGPITITHPEMRRYFMTIEEAVHLVLQAMLIGKGGEIFVLDMGEPLKIADLALELIEFSGLQLGRDIDIEFTNIRPGEKLFEELFLQSDHYQRTEDQKIFVSLNGSGRESKTSEPSEPAGDFHSGVRALIEAARNHQRHAVLQYLKQLVPEYKSENGYAARAFER
ncbi:MAG TPA: nucleoside-diphosphate sugar epimerase/dehydratase [Pyrinomonadaceae bacterium]|nr:nucleoside-diphosphate sugar epimerase/dehydratase [Pyrinomonadaceae bacterium]